MLNQVIRVFQQNQSKADGTVVQWVALHWLHRQQMIAAERLRGKRGSYCCVSCRWPEGGRGVQQHSHALTTSWWLNGPLSFISFTVSCNLWQIKADSGAVIGPRGPCGRPSALFLWKQRKKLQPQIHGRHAVCGLSLQPEGRSWWWWDNGGRVHVMDRFLQWPRCSAACFLISRIKTISGSEVIRWLAFLLDPYSHKVTRNVSCIGQ